MANTGAKSWMKNVAKSIGYIGTDAIASSLPSTIDFFTTNAESVRDEISGVKNPKEYLAMKTGALSEYGKAGKDFMQYLKEDLKSGKIYNRERIEKVGMDDDEFGGFFDDFEGDFNFDGDDTDISSEDGEVNITKTLNVNKFEATISENSPLVKSVKNSTAAIVDTANASNKLNATLSEATINSIGRIGSSITEGISVVNENLGLMVSFYNGPMSKFVESSTKYYDESLRLMSQQIDELRKMSTLQPKAGNSFADPSNVFLSSGGLDIKSYLKQVVRQGNNVIDETMGLSTIKAMMSDKDSLQAMISSPLKGIAEGMVSKILPQFLTQSMESFDNTFKEFFPALLSKVAGLEGSGNNNIFVNLASRILGIKPNRKSGVDLGEYTKGAVPFDGYVRKAIVEVIPGYLRRIESAITGDNERGFDYKTGMFKDAADLQKEWGDKVNQTILNSFSDVRYSMMDSASKIKTADGSDLKLNEKIDQLLTKVATDSSIHGVTTSKKSGSGFRQLDDVLDEMGLSSNDRKYMIGIYNSLGKQQKMGLNGRMRMDAINNRNKLMEEAEANPIEHNAHYQYDGSIIDRGNRDKSDKNWRNKGLSDKFGLNSLDYLRDIKSILLNGIRVYGMGGSAEPDEKGTKWLDNAHKNMTREADGIKSYVSTDIPLSPERQKDLSAGGYFVVDGDVNSDEITRKITETQGKADTKDNTNKLSKLFKGKGQEKFNSINEVVNSVINAPARMIESVFTKIDNTLYSVIFGSSDDGDDNTSFASKAFNMLRTKVTGFGEWMKDKMFGEKGIFTQVKESSMYQSLAKKGKEFGTYLIGNKDENGTRSGGLLSETANELGDVFKSSTAYFSGKEWRDKDGKIHGANSEAVFPQVRGMFNNVKNIMKEHLFGKDTDLDEEGKKKGIITTALNSLHTGFNNFSDAIFGPKTYTGSDGKTYRNATTKGIGDFSKEIKKRAPKSLAFGAVGAATGLLAGGKLGMLGSLFLPGGPIGGAVVGTTIGFLSQSDNFKNWLFGKKDDDGQRVGGFISSRTQKFLKDNKVPIVGGAAIGSLKGLLGGIGILPSMFLPGGPVGGAIMGLGTSMILRSNTVQDFLFGKEVDGKRNTGKGIVGQMFGKMRTDKNAKKAAGTVGAGVLSGAALATVIGKFGLMGAALTPLGPLGGALAGAATGIAIASDKWRTRVFGNFNEKTGEKEGGLLGQVANWAKLSIFAPIKLTAQKMQLGFKEWFFDKVANPFQDALGPIKKAAVQSAVNVKDAVIGGFAKVGEKMSQSFEALVGEKFLSFVDNHILNPLKGFFGGLFKTMMKIPKAILSAPFKLLKGVGDKLEDGDRQRGLKYKVVEEQDEEGNKTYKREKRSLGERIHNRFDATSREAAMREGGVVIDRNGNKVMDSYMTGNNEARKERALEIAKSKDELQKKEVLLNLTKGLAKKYDFANKSDSDSQNATDALYDLMNMDSDALGSMFAGMNFGKYFNKKGKLDPKKLGKMSKQERQAILDKSINLGHDKYEKKVEDQSKNYIMELPAVIQIGNTSLAEIQKETTDLSVTLKNVAEDFKSINENIEKTADNISDNLKVNIETSKAVDFISSDVSVIKRVLMDMWNKISGNVMDVNTPDVFHGHRNRISLPRLNLDGSDDADPALETEGGEGGFGTPYYSQNDPRWGGNKYSKFGNLSKAGCGPTSMAMITSKFGKKRTPDQMAEQSQAGGYNDKTGTNWKFVANAAKENGLTSKQQRKPSASFVNEEISKGNPVLLSGKKNSDGSPYTSKGHYVVATGKDANGNILINDPRGKQYSGGYDSKSTIKDAKSAWAFRKGKGNSSTSGNGGGYGSDEDEDDTTKLQTRYLKRISKDTETIKTEIYGQLDGLGKNVYVMRTMLQEFLGVEGDTDGSANKSRKGFLGKIKSKLLKFVLTPIRAISDGLGMVKDKIVDTVERIVAIPIKIVKTIGGAVKKVGHAIAQIPKLAGKAFLAVAKGLGSAVSSVAKASVVVAKGIFGASKGIILGAGKVITGFGSGIGKVLKGFGAGAGAVLKGIGNGFGSVIKGFGKGVGSILSGLGKVPGQLLNIAGSGLKLVGGVFHTAVNGFVDTLKAGGTLLGGAIKTVAKGITTIVAAPFKAVGHLISTIAGTKKHGANTVYVAGGYLDRINNIGPEGSPDGGGNSGLFAKMKSFFSNKEDNTEGGYGPDDVQSKQQLVTNNYGSDIDKNDIKNAVSEAIKNSDLLKKKDQPFSVKMDLPNGANEMSSGLSIADDSTGVSPAGGVSHWSKGNTSVHNVGPTGGVVGSTEGSVTDNSNRPNYGSGAFGTSAKDNPIQQRATNKLNKGAGTANGSLFGTLGSLGSGISGLLGGAVKLLSKGKYSSIGNLLGGLTGLTSNSSSGLTSSLLGVKNGSGSWKDVASSALTGTKNLAKGAVNAVGQYTGQGNMFGPSNAGQVISNKTNQQNTQAGNNQLAPSRGGSSAEEIRNMSRGDMVTESLGGGSTGIDLASAENMLNGVSFTAQGGRTKEYAGMPGESEYTDSYSRRDEVPNGKMYSQREKRILGLDNAEEQTNSGSLNLPSFNLPGLNFDNKPKSQSVPAVTAVPVALAMALSAGKSIKDWLLRQTGLEDALLNINKNVQTLADVSGEEEGKTSTNVEVNTNYPTEVPYNQPVETPLPNVATGTGATDVVGAVTKPIIKTVVPAIIGNIIGTILPGLKGPLSTELTSNVIKTITGKTPIGADDLGNLINLFSRNGAASATDVVDNVTEKVVSLDDFINLGKNDLLQATGTDGAGFTNITNSLGGSSSSKITTMNTSGSLGGASSNNVVSHSFGNSSGSYSNTPKTNTVLEFPGSKPATNNVLDFPGSNAANVVDDTITPVQPKSNVLEFPGSTTPKSNVLEFPSNKPASIVDDVVDDKVIQFKNDKLVNSVTTPKSSVFSTIAKGSSTDIVNNGVVYNKSQLNPLNALNAVYTGGKDMAYNEIDSFGKSMVNNVLNGAEYSANAMATSGKNVITTTAGKTAKLAVSAGKDAVNVASTVTTVVKKADDLVGRGINKFIDLIVKFFKGMAGNSKVVKLLGESGAAKFLKEVTTNICEKLTLKVVAPFAEKIAAAFARIATETGVEASTLGIGVVVFGVWDATTGALDAANLFMVKDEDVTAPMRAISSILKTLLGLGNIGPILDIATEIIAAVSGFNLKEWVSGKLYELYCEIFDKSAGAAFKEAKTGFDEDYNEFVSETGVNVSKTSYNDVVNQTTGSKILSGLSSVGKGIAGVFVDQKVEEHYVDGGGNTYYQSEDGGYTVYNKSGKKYGVATSLPKDAQLVEETTNKSGISKLGAGIVSVNNEMKKGRDWLVDKATQGMDWVTEKQADARKAVTSFFVGSSTDAWYNEDGSYYVANGQGEPNKITYTYYNANGEAMNKSCDGESVATMIKSGQLIKGTIKKSSGLSAVGKNISDSVSGAWKSFTGNVSSLWSKVTSDANKSAGIVGKSLGAFAGLFTSSKEEAWKMSDGSFYINKGDSYSYYNATGNLVAKGIPKEQINSLISSGVLAKGTVTKTGIFKKALNSISEKVSETWGTLSKAGGEMIDSVKEAGGLVMGTLSKGIKEGGLLGGVKALFSHKKGKGWFDTNGAYYVLQDDGTYTYFNANGDTIATGVDSADITTKISTGLLTEGDIITDSVAKQAISKIKDAVANAWDTAKDTVTNAWDSFTGWITGGSGGAIDVVKGGSGGYGATNSSVTEVIRGGSGGANEVNNFPYYSQNDSRWANNSYSESNGSSQGTISERGCGPTAMAMVTKGVTGQGASPVDVANYAKEKGYSDNTGTNWNFVSDTAKAYGMKATGRLAPDSGFIDSSLEKGKPVILSGTGDESTPYTSKGHYVVAVGKDSSGNYLINDPRGKSYSHAYDPSTVAKSTGAAWAFESNKGGSGSSKPLRRLNKSFKVRFGGYGNTPDEVRLAIVEKMKSLKGTLSYSQTGPRDPSKGSADCSSTVAWCYKEVSGLDIGDNTNAQITSSLGIDVDIASGGGTSKTEYPNETNLKPGDLLFFRSPTSSYAHNVAHVEMYIGDGQCMGHGGGTGPKVHDIKSYQNQRGEGKYYIKARRFVKDDSDLSISSSSLSTGSTDNTLSGILGTFGESFSAGMWKTFGFKDGNPFEASEDGNTTTVTVNGDTGMSGADYIGKYTKQFESGTKGPSAISKGTGDAGGVSFGTYQFPSYKKSVASTGSSLSKFWNQYYSSKYPGVQPGNNDAFKSAWKTEAASDPTSFFNNEHAYMMSNYYNPFKKKNSNIMNPDTHSRAAQEAFWSTATQYGPNSSVIKKAFDGSSATDMGVSNFVNKLQDYKTNSVNTYFSKSSKGVRSSVKERHDGDERNVLLGLDENALGGLGGGYGGGYRLADLEKYDTDSVKKKVDTPKNVTFKADSSYMTTGGYGTTEDSLSSTKSSSLESGLNPEETTKVIKQSNTKIEDKSNTVVMGKILAYLEIISDNSTSSKDSLKNIDKKIILPDGKEVSTSNDKTVVLATNNTNNNSTQNVSTQKKTNVNSKTYQNAKTISKGRFQ